MTSEEEITALPYRPCVGIMLLTRDGRVFVGRRNDTPGDHWQMPQGGIDQGETPRQAALRELEEETGTAKAEIISESREWHTYDLPADVILKLWGGRFRGQIQKWFVLRFLGEDSDIDLATKHQEFSAWKWTEIDQLPALITPFKRPVYERLVVEFRHLVSDTKSL